MNFDHTKRDRDLVVERYLAGQLLEEEAMAFEEHYLDCGDCLDQLETARSLRRGLATVAAEDAARAPWGYHRAFLAAAVLLVAVLPAAWFGFETRRLGSELATTRDQLAAAQAAAVPPERIAELERRLTDQAGRIAEVTGELARERAPEANALLVPLAVQRSGAGASATRLTRPAGAGRVVFALAVGPDDDGPFELALKRAGETLWRGEGLRPDELGEVRVSFHRDSLPPGSYRLELAAPGRRGPVVRYDFRVQPGPDDRP